MLNMNAIDYAIHNALKENGRASASEKVAL